MVSWRKLRPQVDSCATVAATTVNKRLKIRVTDCRLKSDRKMGLAENSPACPVANPTSAQESSKCPKFRQEIGVRPVTLMLEVSPELSMSLLFLRASPAMALLLQEELPDES
jgi:hypothetical protein